MVVAQLAERSLPITEVRPQFESSHRQNFKMNIFTVYCGEDEKKEKETGIAHFKTKQKDQSFH